MRKFLLSLISVFIPTLYLERKKDDKFDARGYRPIVIPRPDEVVKCERNYCRNHLRWYRITCIKRGGRERKRSRERKKEREEEVGTNEQTRIPPGNACKATSFLVSSPTVLSSPLFFSLFPSLAPVFSILCRYLFPVLPCERVHLRSLIAISR